VAKRGIRVADIVSRLRAQEPAGDVADDYGLTIREVGKAVSQQIRDTQWIEEAALAGDVKLAYPPE
jgi:uncharacterized protein (DUF433 family)